MLTGEEAKQRLWNSSVLVGGMGARFAIGVLASHLG